MKSIFLFVLFAFSISASISTLAAPATPEQKANTCFACHGQKGISPNELWPNIAGQKQGYILKQLKAFHDGVRVDPLMSSIAKMLSDADMQELATYFAQLKSSP